MNMHKDITRSVNSGAIEMKHGAERLYRARDKVASNSGASDWSGFESELGSAMPPHRKGNVLA